MLTAKVSLDSPVVQFVLHQIHSDRSFVLHRLYVLFNEYCINELKDLSVRDYLKLQGRVMACFRNILVSMYKPTILAILPQPPEPE
jgi:hypothetical protein